MDLNVTQLNSTEPNTEPELPPLIAICLDHRRLLFTFAIVLGRLIEPLQSSRPLQAIFTVFKGLSVSLVETLYRPFELRPRSALICYLVNLLSKMLIHLFEF